MQYRCLKPEIKFHINENVYVEICERNYHVNLNK